MKAIGHLLIFTAPASGIKDACYLGREAAKALKAHDMPIEPPRRQRSCHLRSSLNRQERQQPQRGCHLQSPGLAAVRPTLGNENHHNNRHANNPNAAFFKGVPIRQKSGVLKRFRCCGWGFSTADRRFTPPKIQYNMAVMKITMIHPLQQSLQKFDKKNRSFT